MSKVTQAMQVGAVQAKEGFFKSTSNLIKGIPKSGKIGMIIGFGLLAGININEYMFSAKKKSGYRAKNQETKNIDFLTRGY